jgi:subtilisin family serine protease
MRFHKTLAALGILAVAACDQDPVAPPTADSPLATPDVAFQDVPLSQDASPQHLIMTRKAPDQGLLDAIAEAGGEVVFQHDIGFVFVRGLSDDAAAELSGVKGVTDVQADEWFAIDAGLSGDPSAARIASPDDPTTATQYARQWNMRAIAADEAWAAGRLGSPDVTVAILDTGIDYLYPDLQGRVDLGRSISFVEIDDLFAEFFFPDRELITDLHFHGTHVAATAVSNALVTAGVTSGATLMGVKVCTFTDFSCSFGAVISGLLHAADNGADVLNLSLGGGFPKAGNGRFVGFINSTFNYVRSQGATIVVAAGNAGSDLDRNGNFYASYCDTPATICVAATGPLGAESPVGPFFDVDAPTTYTNFGRSAIDVAAPGGTGVAPVWAGCSTTSLLLAPCQTGIFIVGLTGTSMASPHVAGLAALLVEDYGRNPGRIKTAIQQGADDLGQRGTDPFYGKGRINVANTLGIGSESLGNARGRGGRGR